MSLPKALHVSPVHKVHELMAEARAGVPADEAAVLVLVEPGLLRVPEEPLRVRMGGDRDKHGVGRHRAEERPRQRRRQLLQHRARACHAGSVDARREDHVELSVSLDAVPLGAETVEPALERGRRDPVAACRRCASGA